MKEKPNRFKSSMKGGSKDSEIGRKYLLKNAKVIVFVIRVMKSQSLRDLKM